MRYGEQAGVCMRAQGRARALRPPEPPGGPDWPHCCKTLLNCGGYRKLCAHSSQTPVDDCGGTPFEDLHWRCCNRVSMTPATLMVRIGAHGFALVIRGHSNTATLQGCHYQTPRDRVPPYMQPRAWVRSVQQTFSMLTCDSGVCALRAPRLAKARHDIR